MTIRDLIIDDDESVEQAVQHRTAAMQQNISRREQAECEFRAVCAETEHVLASISSLFIGVDENGVISRWNEAATRTFGVPAVDIIGKPFTECGLRLQDCDITDFATHCQAVNAPTRIDELRFIDRTGREGFLGVTINPIKRNGKQRGGFLLLGRDVTQRRDLEDQLRQAQKMEAIGQLAAGIAHELNTPIQYVGDNTSFLSDAFISLQRVLVAHSKLLTEAKAGTVTSELICDVEQAVATADISYLSDEIPKAIQQSLEGVQRVTKIVRAMKEFAHPGNEKTPIDINRAIENTITVARNEWKYVADVVTEFDSLLPLVPCLAGEFNQAILNLIVNAAHAIDDVVKVKPGTKGTITVTTSRARDHVEIRIRDTGTGIPEELRSRIFDPFFTTKPVGKGTGQGLALSHVVIVKKHNGTIAFETEIDKGTTFIIRLPLGNSASGNNAKEPWFTNNVPILAEAVAT